jgi:glycosyltransferase involved in cell wall biosynthesis
MYQFSIILPVRNGGEYVKECVNSILAQSYQNFNLIVLDNNSSDGTKEWIESLNNNKITIYPSTKDLTITENWARAVDVPKSEFMTLIGHDDILYPNYLQVINDLINEYPDASLYHTHFNYIDANGNVVRVSKSMPLKADAIMFTKLFLNSEIDTMGTGYVFKSNSYDKLGGIPVKYPSLLFADFELWLNLIEISYKAIARENCFAFRIHQSTTTTSNNSVYLNAFEIFIQFLKSKKNNSYLDKIIELNCIFYIKKYTQGLTHRLIKTPTHKRIENETVKYVISRVKFCANQLLPNNDFQPLNNFSVRLALWIDSNILTRKLFLFVKNIYKKPVLE